MAVEPPPAPPFDTAKSSESSHLGGERPTARAGRWLAVAMFASLGVNLFLGGMLTVEFLRRDPHRDAPPGVHGAPPGPPPAAHSGPPREHRRGLREGRRGAPGDDGRMLFHAAEVLGDPGHPLVSRLKEQTAPQLRERRQAMRVARKKVGETLRAKPFDEAALGAALASLRAETAGSQELLHHTLVELAAHMDDQQRAELAKRARRFGKWGPASGGPASGGPASRPLPSGPPSE